MPKNNLPEVYLDLDRTLFKTSEFIGEVWQVIGEVNDGVDSSAELSRLADFYIENQDDDDYRDYDFSKHLKAVGLPVAEVYGLIRDRLKSDNFEHSGVSRLLRRLDELGLAVKIFTYGRDDFQKLKFDLSPFLAEYELITTLKPKHTFFEELAQKAILLDDKPIGEQMPDNVTFIQSIGYNGVEPLDEFDWQTVSLLEEFADVVEGLISGDKNV